MSISADDSIYLPGDTITVTLVGDTSLGAGAALSAVAKVVYGAPSLVDGAGAVASQDVITSFAGNISWSAFNTPCAASECYVFNQIAGVQPLQPDPDVYIGTLQIPAVALGTLTLTIDASTFEWFGAPPPPPIEVTIVAPTPLTKISDTQGYLSAPGSPGSNPGGLLKNNDEFGHSVEGIGDLDRDGVPDIAVGAPEDDDSGANAGAVYIVFLNGDGTVKGRQKIREGAGGLLADLDPFDNFGADVALIHDVDGDGVQDIAVAAPRDSDGASGAGAVYILFLNTDGSVKAEQKISNLSGGLGSVNQQGDEFGDSPAGLGDLDGDGIPDVAVGSRFDYASDTGSLYILLLNADGTVKASQKIAPAGVHTPGGLGGFTGSVPAYGYFGSGLANLGDLDGDGRPELAVGAQADGSGDGSVYLLSLNPDGTVASEREIREGTSGFVGPTDSDDRFAWPARIGDLDGDGVGDMAVGAPRDDDRGLDSGAVWILYLNPDGSVHDESKFSFLPQLGTGDYFGSGVSSPGDLDGDGVSDLIVGAFGDDDGGANRGAVYTIFLGGVAASCGNDVLDPVELCDDGNTLDGDGCPATCGIPSSSPVPAMGTAASFILGILIAALGALRVQSARTASRKS